MLSNQDIKLLEQLLCKEEFRLLEELDGLEDKPDKDYKTFVVGQKQLEVSCLLLKIRRLKTR